MLFTHVFGFGQCQAVMCFTGPLLQWLFGLQGAVLFCILLFALALLPLVAIDEARGLATARRTDEGARAGGV